MEKLSKEERVLHEQFVEYGANARAWLNKCKLMLLEIDRRRIWEKRGFASLYEYAAKLAGMSQETVDVSLWILRHIEDKPELVKIAKKKGLGAVRSVASIATAETAAFWAKKVDEMSKHTLELYVSEYRKQMENSEKKETDKIVSNLFGVTNCENDLKLCPGARLDRDDVEVSNQQCIGIDSEARLSEMITLFMSVKPQVAQDLEKLRGGSDWNVIMEDFLNLRKEMLEREMPEAIETNSQYVPVLIERFVLKRSNCICEFPCCMRQFTELHHADRFKRVHRHDPARIFALCEQHHKLAHQGLIAREEKDIRFWGVRDAVDERDPRYGIDQLVMKFRKQAQGR